MPHDQCATLIVGLLCPQGVRAELAPWEQQMAEVQSRLDVAAAERDLLTKQQSDAKQRLQVCLQLLSSTSTGEGTYQGLCQHGPHRASRLSLSHHVF